jgi:hypothetical protein
LVLSLMGCFVFVLCFFDVCFIGATLPLEPCASAAGLLLPPSGAG